MRKFLLLLAIIPLLFNCSSDDSSGSVVEPSVNFITISGTTYPLDRAIIQKIVNESPQFVTYAIGFESSDESKRLSVQLMQASGDIASVTYPYKSSTGGSNFGKVMVASSFKTKIPGTENYSTIFNQGDFIGAESNSRIIVKKNSETNYTFDIHFVTSLGNVIGTYSGEVTKNF